MNKNVIPSYKCTRYITICARYITLCAIQCTYGSNIFSEPLRSTGYSIPFNPQWKANISTMTKYVTLMVIKLSLSIGQGIFESSVDFNFHIFCCLHAVSNLIPDINRMKSIKTCNGSDLYTYPSGSFQEKTLEIKVCNLNVLII